MSHSQPATRPSGLHFGAKAGILIGFSGWVIALAAVALATGALGDFAVSIALGLVVSLALGLATVRSAATFVTGPGRDRPHLRYAFLGYLAIDAGVLCFFITHFVAPRIEENERTRELLERLGAGYAVPDWVSGLVVLTGAVLILVSVLRARRVRQP